MTIWHDACTNCNTDIRAHEAGGSNLVEFHDGIDPIMVCEFCKDKLEEQLDENRRLATPIDITDTEAGKSLKLALDT
jgi:hypothetical protein